MTEEVITHLILNGGDARGKALSAIQMAKQKEFQKAAELLNECNDKLVQAHEFQTAILQKSLNGDNKETDLLLIHGQDHLMDALVVRDLALEIVEMYKIIYEMNKEK